VRYGEWGDGNARDDKPTKQARNRCRIFGSLSGRHRNCRNRYIDSSKTRTNSAVTVVRGAPALTAAVAPRHRLKTTLDVVPYVRSLCARWLNTKIMPSQVARCAPEAVSLTASQVARGAPEAVLLTASQVARGGPEAVLLTARLTRRQNFFRTSSPGGSFRLGLFAHVVTRTLRVSCGAALAGHYVRPQRLDRQC